MKSNLLIVIDMLNDFIDSEGVLFCGETARAIVSYIHDRVKVVGVCTSICVMDTVGGLVNRDYAVQVPRNGVADFDQHAHAAALQRMEKIYGAKIV